MQWLLVTDLDNTLVGDDAALERLNAQLIQARSLSNTFLVYSTGRSLTSYRQLCTSVSLLPPDLLVTAVGTEVYAANESEPMASWAAQLQQGWDRALAVQAARAFSALTPQPDTEQRPFKVSYFLRPSDAPAVMAELADALREAGLSAQLIYSGSKDLDILPQQANKGQALQFVQAQLGVATEHTIAAGDSGNDIALFGANRGIIVGNAQPELLDWHRQNLAPHRYLATAHYAAGIQEGLEYFGLLPVG
ncbi:MAG TPA: sucrose-phosphate phosphatase [Stenomitos sp.]